ncbi:hypothetical protein AV521_35275 [Streptomyces sp. IMTB 2501]|nr:hypothetical protein AV521_35275 [Streptomyces sp. IMTB 2501]
MHWLFRAGRGRGLVRRAPTEPRQPEPAAEGKEVWLLFDNERGRFPLYAGESVWIEYAETSMTQVIEVRPSQRMRDLGVVHRAHRPGTPLRQGHGYRRPADRHRPRSGRRPAARRRLRRRPPHPPRNRPPRRPAKRSRVHSRGGIPSARLRPHSGAAPPPPFHGEPAECEGSPVTPPRRGR